METATALYYTFSTIAQALAAAMALLAAFALYRLKAINDECLQSALVMESDSGGGTSVRAPAYASNWAEVRQELERRVRDGQGGDWTRETVPPRLARLERLLKAHSRVLTALWVSLALTGLVAAWSVYVLAKVPGIVTSGHADATLNAGVVTTAACLASYVWLVYEAFRRL